MSTSDHHLLSSPSLFLNLSPSPRSVMADTSNHDTHGTSGDDTSAAFLMTHPPLGAASAAAAADPLLFSDSPDLDPNPAPETTADDSARTNHSSSNSPTGGRSGSGGGGSSGNEASISNTSGGSDNGGNSSAQKSSSSSTSPATNPTGAAVGSGGASSSAGPTKLSDREHHVVYHHRGLHQSPARPAPIAGAAASVTGGSSDGAAEVDSHLFARPPPLQLREAVNSSATCWSPPKPPAPVGRTMPVREQDEDEDELETLPFLTATAHPSQSTLPTASSSTQGATSADSGPLAHAAAASAGHHPLEAVLGASSSTIATTNAGSSGRGSGKSRKANGKPKPFVCDQCGIGFSRFQNLKSHMLTHQNVRPFPCEECGQAFSRLHDLKRHQRLHTGARPFTCPNCFRSFARLDALNRHRESNSCQNVNLPQSLRDVALAHAAISSGAAANPLHDLQEDIPVGIWSKRGRPTRAQAAAALSTSTGNLPAAHKTNAQAGTAAAASNNASASPPGAANGNRSSTDSRPATSVSNSIVPSDSVSQQHARRGHGVQRNNQSSDSSDGPRPPAPVPMQRPAKRANDSPGGGAASALRGASPLDLQAHPSPYNTHVGRGGADVASMGAPPARALINAATESWRVQQRQYGGPPAMAPGPALHMWGSPPGNMYAGRAGAGAAAAPGSGSASMSPLGHQVDLASPLFLASIGAVEPGRKRRRGTSTSPVVGGTPPGSQVAPDQQRSRMGAGEQHAGGGEFGGEFDGEGGGGAGPEMDVEMFDMGPARAPDSGRWERNGALDFGPAPPGAAGAHHRSAVSHHLQQQHGRERGTPPQGAGVGMSSASGANQSGSNSSAHVKGSTRTGGPLPVLNSSSGHSHPYQVHQAQSVDATVAAGGGDTSAGGTPQPQPHGSLQQHHQHAQQHHAGLEVMHRRLDMLMQDNLWLRSRIVDLEHQSQADRMRMMEQDDQIRALLVERNVRRGGSQDQLAGADGGGGHVPGPSAPAGSSRSMPAPHGRSSSFLPPQSHGRYYDPAPYGHASPQQQYYAEDVYGYPPMVSGSGGGPRWNNAASGLGYSDLVEDAYRHGQQPPRLPSPARHPARHSAYYQQHQSPAYPPHQEHSRYDPRDAAVAMHQAHVQQQIQYPRYDEVEMDDEMDYAAALHASKRRRVMSPADADVAGGDVM